MLQSKPRVAFALLHFLPVLFLDGKGVSPPAVIQVLRVHLSHIDLSVIFSHGVTGSEDAEMGLVHSPDNCGFSFFLVVDEILLVVGLVERDEPLLVVFEVDLLGDHLLGVAHELEDFLVVLELVDVVVVVVDVENPLLADCHLLSLQQGVVFLLELRVGVAGCHWLHLDLLYVVRQVGIDLLVGLQRFLNLVLDLLALVVPSQLNLLGRTILAVLQVLLLLVVVPYSCDAPLRAHKDLIQVFGVPAPYLLVSFYLGGVVHLKQYKLMEMDDNETDGQEVDRDNVVSDMIRQGMMISSGLKGEAAQVSVVIHQQVGSALYTDVVGVSFSNYNVPGGPVSLVQDFLDCLGGQLRHVGNVGIGLDACDNRIRYLCQHLS